MEKFIYLGIYVRAGLRCRIAAGFGPSCLKPLQLCFKKGPDLGSPVFTPASHKTKRLNKTQAEQAFKDSIERQIRQQMSMHRVKYTTRGEVDDIVKPKQVEVTVFDQLGIDTDIL